MSQIFMVELSDSAVLRAREAAKRAGLSVEAMLSEWIERGGPVEETSELILDTGHTIYTPQGGEDTAQALFEFLKSEERKD
jgi:hypothetical protein